MANKIEVHTTVEFKKFIFEYVCLNWITSVILIKVKKCDFNLYFRENKSNHIDVYIA